MKRTDIIFLLILLTATLLIFYPVFYAQYLYTDEVTQLWLSKKGLNYQTSIPQGRYLSYKLFEGFFRSISTVQQVIDARLFSLAGWIGCLPIWYFIIQKVSIKNNLPKPLVLLSMAYLVTMPPFIIYIGWSACMELFIACTISLIAGYVLYDGIQYRANGFIKLTKDRLVLCTAMGLIALFTYQTGFGCFLIPFFIHFISTKKFNKNIYTGIGFSLLIYLLYFFLFKATVNLNHVSESARTAFATNPINKLFYLLSRPLASAFHFTYLFNEKDPVGFVVYFIVAGGWLFTTLLQQKANSFYNKIIYLAGVLVFLVLIYLPSMIVKENYSSNRTLFALDIAVFFLVAETIFALIKTAKARAILTGLLATLFLINAWYNYTKQFLQPLTAEYFLLKKFVSSNYNPTINTVYFILADEKSFEKKYHTVISWDEFGLPSTAKNWVPEPLLKQLIFEQTGNRQMAENIIIRTWVDKAAFQSSKPPVFNQVLLIDMPDLLSK